MRLDFFDKNDSLIKTIRITELTISESVLTRRSIDIYNDPAPCIIRRSAISETMYAGLMEFFETHGRDRHKPCALSEIPHSVAECFCFDAEVCRIACHK